MFAEGEWTFISLQSCADATEIYKMLFSSFCLMRRRRTTLCHGSSEKPTKRLGDCCNHVHHKLLTAKRPSAARSILELIWEKLKMGELEFIFASFKMEILNFHTLVLATQYLCESGGKPLASTRKDVAVLLVVFCAVSDGATQLTPSERRCKRITRASPMSHHAEHCDARDALVSARNLAHRFGQLFFAKAPEVVDVQWYLRVFFQSAARHNTCHSRF